jgi:hypothetical protein
MGRGNRGNKYRPTNRLGPRRGTHLKALEWELPLQGKYPRVASPKQGPDTASGEEESCPNFRWHWSLLFTHFRGSAKIYTLPYQEAYRVDRHSSNELYWVNTSDSRNGRSRRFIAQEFWPRRDLLVACMHGGFLVKYANADGAPSLPLTAYRELTDLREMRSEKSKRPRQGFDRSRNFGKGGSW